MGLDQSIRTDSNRIQSEMAERAKGTVPYAGIADEVAFYEERLSHADPTNKFYAMEERVLDSARQTVGNWRYCYFLHNRFEQVCQEQFGHGLDDNGNILYFVASELGALLTDIRRVLYGFEKGEETGRRLAKDLLPNVGPDGDDEGYGETYRTQLEETAEWILAVLSIPDVQAETFRYVYSY